MHTASVQPQSSPRDALDKAKSLSKVISLTDHRLAHISLCDLLNTPKRRQNYADTILNCINYFIEDQPILANQITSIARQLNRLFNNSAGIDYGYIQNIITNLPKLIIYGQLARIKQLRQNLVANYLELKNASARLDELQSGGATQNDETKKKIRQEQQQLADFHLKSSALYENLREELALGLAFFPESKERDLLHHAANILNDCTNSEETVKVDQAVDAYTKVQKTSLNTLEEDNDPAQHYYPAAFAIIEAGILRHIKKALALLTSQANALSIKQFFRHILKLIQLINKTLNINYQVSGDQSKIAQLHISYRTLKHALTQAAKYAINNLSDIEVIQFIENRNQDFVNLVAIMPLQGDSYLDNITAEFIFEIFESHIAPRYRSLCPERPLHPENPLEIKLISEDIQARAYNYTFDDDIQDTFSSCMDRAEVNLQHHASYADSVTIEQSDLNRLKKVNTPKQFLSALGKLTKMFVNDCQGDLVIGLKKLSLLLQHKPLITVNYRERQLTEAQTSSFKCNRALEQGDFESIIAFCNSRNFTDVVNDLKAYLPDESAHELNTVRLAMTNLKRFLNHHFNIKVEKYQATNQSLSYIQRTDHALRKHRSPKMLRFLGQPYTTSAPSKSREGIELELKSVNRRNRESVDATASNLYQWALFKRDSSDSSPRRSNDTNALLNDTCRNFLDTHPIEDKEITQLKLKADCLKKIKAIVYADELTKSGQISYTFFGARTHHFQAKGVAQFRPALKNFVYEEDVNEDVLIDQFFLNALFKKITELHTQTVERKDTYPVADCCIEKNRTQKTQLAYNKIEKTLKDCNLALQKVKSILDTEDSVIEVGDGNMYDVDLHSTPPLSPATLPDISLDGEDDRPTELVDHTNPPATLPTLAW
jgi:hypothetical protein